MEQNNNCPLYGTKTCAMLHMENCEQCRANVADKAAVAQTEEMVEAFLEKMPDPPAQLFESDTCLLCREEAGPKDGYAMFTFGHPEPHTVIKHLILKRQASAGMMVPLQFAVCKKCRARMLVCDYLPLVTTVVFAAVSLIIISRQPVSDRLNAINELLPLGLWAACTLFGYAAGLLFKHAAGKAFGKKTFLNVLEHPFVKRMTENGWFSIPADKIPKAVFSKRLIGSGLGTAPSKLYETAKEPDGDGNKAPEA